MATIAIPRHRVRDEHLKRAAMLAVIGLLCFSTLQQVVAMPTWPMNHEIDSFFKRTAIYAQHIAQGDYFPIYSSADNLGFGSAQPALYHKLFYLVSGWLYFLGLSLKGSVVASIWAFMVLGSIGLYGLCRVLECSRGVALVGALMLPLANYTVTNWLVRGALAEFAAGMLVPWVLMYFLGPCNHRTYVKLGLAMAGLFLAHSVLAYFLAVLLMSVTSILTLSRVTGRQVLKSAPLLLSMGVFVAIISPYLFAMHALSHDYDMTRIIPAQYQPQSQIKDFKLYFWDDAAGFGGAWESFTVQLDWPVLALLVASAVACWRKGGRCVDASTIGLAWLVGLALLLQTRLALPFYELMPGALYIQFPWRLLAIMTPALIALALAFAHRGIPRALSAAGLALAAMVLVSGAYVRAGFMLPAVTPDLNGLVFSTFSEYVPKALTAKEIPAVDEVYSVAKAHGCTVLEINPQQESLERRFTATCTRGATVAVPIFSTPHHVVELWEKRLPCDSGSPYPFLCSVSLSAGQATFAVRSPTFASMASQQASRLR